MCTLTWWRDDDRYSLFFNRDELKTRLPALPPEIREKDGVRFIAPIDADRGGTWLLVNALGVSLGILNHYQGAIPLIGRSPNSRGHLALSLASLGAPDAIERRLEKLDLRGYFPFYLFAISPNLRAPALWTWDGKGPGPRRDALETPPLSTSSFRPEEVISRRTRCFNDVTSKGITPECLEAFHLSTDPENSAYSVRMRRPDAQTISFSRIDVDARSVSFTYRPEPRESMELNESVTVSLPRVSPASAPDARG